MSLERALTTLIAALPDSSAARRLVAVAGPPASGKTTLAEHLAQALPNSAFVPMDGFHLDDSLLHARGDHARKGAAHTFDAAGFVALVARLHRGEDVVAPLFDRSRELSLAGALHIPTDIQTVVIEGNYLLHDAPIWNVLPRYWDFSVFLDVPEDVLTARLEDRWLGFGYTQSDARAKAALNDLPNARSVLAQQLRADLVLDVNGEARRKAE